jgi:hypothetical protein
LVTRAPEGVTALTYHLTSYGHGPVSAEATRKAIELAAYLETHARRLRLRKRQDIQDAISRLLAERVGASKSRVIDEISSIAFAEASEAISVSDKLSALALLSKVLGLQVHKQEISGPGGQPMTLTLEAGTARERIAAKLDAIASRWAAELPPIPFKRVGDVYSAVPAGRLQGDGQRE